MAFRSSKKAIQRLMKDREELIQSPVQNVSAAPLDSDMFEWHCNIRQDKDTMYHVILFFPNDYPYSSPSAEFVPTGLHYSGGAIQKGKKGDQICLNIFSDFKSSHAEWAFEKGGGWSPGYTAQTILLNVISFLAEYSSDKTYQHLCQKFTCKDCKHTFKKPYPPLDHVITQTTKCETSNEAPQADAISSTCSEIVDYISKEKFDPSGNQSSDELFGYGLVLTQTGHRSILTSPCEFLTSETFHSMKRTKGVIHSIMKEELSYFLPLYINNAHGSKIRDEFQTMLKSIHPVLFPEDEIDKPNIVYRALERWNIVGSQLNYAEVILKLIPNLMCSTVVEFSKGSTHTSDNSLKGYFALHRLFIWAMDVYPGLEDEVERRLETFVADAENRTKESCPDIGQWLMLLSVSKQFTWQSVAEAYLTESYKRNVMWYLKSEGSLGYIYLSQDERLTLTFKLTSVSRNLLAFQVAFLSIAKPGDMTMAQILDRYEANLGFPNTEMVAGMKEACQKIKCEINNYEDWYRALGLEYPSSSSLFETLKSSVISAKGTKGYCFKQNRSRR